MKKFLALTVAIGLLIAANPATAKQGLVYQGIIGASGPSTTTIAAMVTMPNGRLAVAYTTNTGISVVIYDNSGNTIRTLSFPNNVSPEAAFQDLAIDSSGRFVIIFYNFDNYQGTVQIYDAAGKFVASKNVGQVGGPITIGSGNSIIVSGSGPGPEPTDTTTIYDANLNTLSSFSMFDTIESMVPLNGKLLTETFGGLELLNYAGKVAGKFPATGNPQAYSPLATPPGQTRAFFEADTGTRAVPKTGIGVFDTTGKLLQQVPYSEKNVKFLAATSADTFFVANAHQLTGIQRYAMGTLPPAPIARAVSATVKAGQNTSILVMKYASHGPFHDLNIGKAPAKGTAVLVSLNTIKYTARATSSVTDTFTYTVWNSTGSSTGTVTVTIPPAAPIIGSPQTISTTENKPVTINVTNGAQNAPFKSVAVATPPAHGKAVPNKLTIVYTPDANFTGSDSFTYTVSNAGGASAPGTVNVLVGN